MSVEAIKAIFAYIIALVTVTGGGWLLFATFDRPAAEPLLVMVGGFIGATLQFVYGQEVQTRTARQTETANRNGGNGA